MINRNSQPEEFLFGIRPVVEAISSGTTIDKIMIRQGMRGEGIKELMDLIALHRISFQYVPEAKLNQFTRKNHQGIIAFVSLVEYQLLEEVIDRIYSQGKDPFILLLDRITDVRNFGAIARTAECAGVDAIVIQEKGAARITPDAVKASAGALMKIAVCRVQNIFKSAVTMMEHGLAITAATEKGSMLYHETDFSGPLCVVLGSEEDGISAPLLKMSSKKIAIPQYGEIASLNVSVAAGIILFEAARQRNKVALS